MRDNPLVEEIDLADWRRSVGELYAQVRAISEPAEAHAFWRTGRDELFRTHPQSPLRPDDPLRASGLSYWPYDERLRFELEVAPERDGPVRHVETGRGVTTTLRRIGELELPAPLDATVALWWLEEYSGGLFLPLRDGTANRTSYGAGRYLLDTAKGADLGGEGSTLVVDCNFLYHPSCRYSPEWLCPLAGSENTIAAEVRAGERL